MIKDINMSEKKYFCLFGQVDTGKSTLAGRIIYECGNIDDHTFQKHCKSCKGSTYALWSRFFRYIRRRKRKIKNI
jgi:translation elongation factor EF-1alpha